jgi:hypothetical protein
MFFLGKMNYWTEKEDNKIRLLHKNFKVGEIKDVAFRKLAVELGRTYMAVSRRYYTLFPAKEVAKGVVVTRLQQQVKDVEVERIDKRKLRTVGKMPRFIWTEETLTILKREIEKVAKNKQNVEQLSLTLSNELNLSRATVFNKLRDIKLITKSKNWSAMHNALKNITLDKINEKVVVGKSNKINEKNVVVKKETKKEVTINQNSVVDNSESNSFWQKINPFYRIKKLEKEISELKSKLK